MTVAGGGAFAQVLLCDVRSLHMRARDEGAAAPAAAAGAAGAEDGGREWNSGPASGPAELHFDNVLLRFTIDERGRVLVSSCALARVPR